MKTVTLIGIALLAVGGAIFLTKKFKKEYNKLEKEEKARKANLDNAGIPAEKLDAEIDPDDKDQFVKTVYTSIEFCDSSKVNWDRDMIRIDSEEGKQNGFYDSKKVIHVLQSDTNEGKYINFLFDIQDEAFLDKQYARTSNCRRHPEVRDYVTTLKSLTKLIGSKLNKIHSEMYPNSNVRVNFNDLVKSKLVGYYVVNFKIRGDESKKTIQKVIQIPEDNYKNLAPGDMNVALSRYAKDLLNRRCGYESSTYSLESIIKGRDDIEEEDIIDLELVPRIIMEYKISIPIYIEGVQLGIDVKETLDLIRYFLENLVIKRENDPRSEEIMYDHIIFNTYDPEFPFSKEGDYLFYYTVTTEDVSSSEFGRRRIIVNNYSYESD